MKLLILTQKIDINDDVLGFFHDWVKEFARNCEQVTVVCLQKGEHDLPANVKVLSLGKEDNSQKSIKSKVHKVKSQLIYVFRFYKYIYQERKNYDAVFVHMNPEYAVLGGICWRLWGKKIALWYTHKQVDLKLRIASWFVNKIFTASKESCGLKSDKIEVVEHGINLKKYQVSSIKYQGERKDNFNIIYIGRISPIKNQKLLIQAIDVLTRRDVALPRLGMATSPRFKVKFIGRSIYKEDEEYQVELKKIVKEKKLENIIEFTGSVPNKDIINYYQTADLAVNLCPTGGVDKAVLEALACGLPVIALNKTFVDLLSKYQKEMILKGKEIQELADKIHLAFARTEGERKKMGEDLRSLAVAKFGLESLIEKICAFLKI